MATTTTTTSSSSNPQPKPAVSFIGLGAMGFGMATNLLAQGHAVTGFDVHAPTLARFAQAGGLVAPSPAAATASAPVCVCMVATAQQADSVLWGGSAPAAPALPRDAALLLCSTVPCAYVQGLARALAERGRGDVGLVDCPVSGGAGRAALGTLSIMVGGDEGAVRRGRAVLAAMADPAKLYLVAGGVGAGSNMKMVHQVLAACQILGAGEAMGLAAHMGLDLKSVGAAVVGSSNSNSNSTSPASKPKTWSWMFENRLPRMLDPEFGPLASALNIILKDAQIITSEARRHGFPTLLTSVAEQVYLAHAAAGFGPRDDSSVLSAYTAGMGKMGPVQGSAETAEQKMALVQDLLVGIHLCAAAESLVFAHRVGLDLEQVLDLCVNAAGGSSQLAEHGGALVGVLRQAKSASADHQSGRGELQTHAVGLRRAVEEAARLKVPLFLGNQALRVFEMAALGGEGGSFSSLVRVWGA